MKTTTALIVKFLMTFAFAFFAFGVLDGNTLGWVLTIAVIATAGNYIMGDLIVLPKFGNLIASVGDGLMGALFAFILAALVTPAFVVSFTGLATFFVLIAIGEYFFHQYLLNTKEVAPS